MPRNSYKRYTKIRSESSYRKRRFIILLLSSAIIIFTLFLSLLTLLVLPPLTSYRDAVFLFESGDYPLAAEAFFLLGDYKNSFDLFLDSILHLGLEALEQNDLEKALTYYRQICTPFTYRAEYMCSALYAYAVEKIDTPDYQKALNLFEEELSGYADCDYLAQSIRFGVGMTYFSDNAYEQAFSILISVDPELIPEAVAAVEQCKEDYYSIAVDEFETINRPDGVLAVQISIPDAFFSPILDEYKDTEKYRIFSGLLGAWRTRDREKNISLVYELGDFLNSADYGFAMQRLYRRRFTSLSGRYFTILDDGSADTNLPRYRLGGYLGLYSKIENGIYYIGSDEARWTKQFSFSFADFDKTLLVYCYSNGYTYTLTLDETPVYG